MRPTNIDQQTALESGPKSPGMKLKILPSFRVLQHFLVLMISLQASNVLAKPNPAQVHSGTPAVSAPKNPENPTTILFDMEFPAGFENLEPEDRAALQKLSDEWQTFGPELTGLIKRLDKMDFSKMYFEELEPVRLEMEKMIVRLWAYEKAFDAIADKYLRKKDYTFGGTKPKEDREMSAFEKKLREFSYYLGLYNETNLEKRLVNFSKDTEQIYASHYSTYDRKTIHKEVLNYDGLAVVVFSGQYCKPCDMMEPAFGAMAKSTPDVKFGKFMLDKDPEFQRVLKSRMANKGFYPESDWPIIVIFGKGEKILAVQDGAVFEEDLKDLIAEARSKM